MANHSPPDKSLNVDASSFNPGLLRHISTPSEQASTTQAAERTLSKCKYYPKGDCVAGSKCKRFHDYNEISLMVLTKQIDNVIGMLHDIRTIQYNMNLDQKNLTTRIKDLEETRKVDSRDNRRGRSQSRNPQSFGRGKRDKSRGSISSAVMEFHTRTKSTERIIKALDASKRSSNKK